MVNCKRLEATSRVDPVRNLLIYGEESCKQTYCFRNEEQLNSAIMEVVSQGSFIDDDARRISPNNQVVESPELRLHCHLPSSWAMRSEPR